MTAICGSDLHVLNGRIPGMTQGSILGHEFVAVSGPARIRLRLFLRLDRLSGAFLRVLAFGFSADIGFIHFDSTVQHGPLYFFHSSADAVAEIPSGLVADLDRSPYLVSRNSFLAFDHQIDGQKPFPKRQMCVVKDRSTSDRKLITALVAIVLIALRDCRNAFRFTARTLNAFRPFQIGKISAALFVSSKTLNQVDQVYV